MYLVGISSGAESTLVVSRFERIILPDLRERLPDHFPREPKLLVDGLSHLLFTNGTNIHWKYHPIPGKARGKPPDTC